MSTTHITLPPIITTFPRPITPGQPTDPMESTPSSPTWIPERPHSAGLSRRPSYGSVSSGTASSAWRVEPGSFITFALDMEALAQQFEGHPEAYESVRNFRRGKYLGLVVASFAHKREDGRFAEELLVLFSANTLPPIAEVEHHHLLVEPNDSDLVHLPPLRTTTMLPWADLIQWTSLGTRILVLDKFHESTLSFALQDEEMNRFEDQAGFHHQDMEFIMPLESADDQNILEQLRIPEGIVPVEVWRDIRMTDSDKRENPATWIVETEYVSIAIQEWERSMMRQRESEVFVQHWQERELEELEMAEQELREQSLQEEELRYSEEAQVQEELMDFGMEE